MVKPGDLIMVVDDEETIRLTAAALLAMKGYEVITAEDGLAALEVLSQRQPRVLISDIRMPRMDGFELLSVVRKRFPEIGVIAISGQYLVTPFSENIMRDAFFSKGNYSREDLFEKISELIAKYPIRQPHAKTALAPVWIPRSGQDFLLTCPHCLRSFSVPRNSISTTVKIQTKSCLSCDHIVSFRLELRS